MDSDTAFIVALNRVQGYTLLADNIVGYKVSLIGCQFKAVTSIMQNVGGGGF